MRLPPRLQKMLRPGAIPGWILVVKDVAPWASDRHGDTYAILNISTNSHFGPPTRFSVPPPPSLILREHEYRASYPQSSLDAALNYPGPYEVEFAKGGRRAARS